MWKFVLGLVLLVPGTALAQEGGVSETPEWLPLVLAGLAAITPALLSALLPSKETGIGGAIMKVVDILAFNWGRARNDPASQ